MVWICQYIQCTDPFRAATSHVAEIIRRVSDTLGLRFLHSTLPLVLMGIHNLVTSAILDWGNSIYVTLYMWFTSVINPRVLCVSALPIQGWHLCTEIWPCEVGSLQLIIQFYCYCFLHVKYIFLWLWDYTTSGHRRNTLCAIKRQNVTGWL